MTQISGWLSGCVCVCIRCWVDGIYAITPVPLLPVSTSTSLLSVMEIDLSQSINILPAWHVTYVWRWRNLHLFIVESKKDCLHLKLCFKDLFYPTKSPVEPSVPSLRYCTFHSKQRQTSLTCLISISTGRSAPVGRGWPSPWTSTSWCPPSPPPSPDTETGSSTLLPDTQSIRHINTYLSLFIQTGLYNLW